MQKSVQALDPAQLIEAVSKELQSIDSIKAPEWAPFVKTGVHKEHQPTQADWWYTRLAAILRTVALVGPVGTNKLRVKYGGKKDNGKKRSHFAKGSGSVARKALQQLEAAGLIKQATVLTRKGRILAPKGQQLLNNAARKMTTGGKK